MKLIWNSDFIVFWSFIIQLLSLFILVFVIFLLDKQTGETRRRSARAHDSGALTAPDSSMNSTTTQRKTKQQVRNPPRRISRAPKTPPRCMRPPCSTRKEGGDSSSPPPRFSAQARRSRTSSDQQRDEAGPHRAASLARAVAKDNGAAGRAPTMHST